MTTLSDAAVRRLRVAATWPVFTTDRYTVLREIGRGGMGTVYLAKDATLRREVAVKVPHATFSAEVERRLEQEARVLARLEHPGIVPVHDSGHLADGRLYYVMKYVKGRTLRDNLAGIPDINDRLAIFERLCDPVAFAHAQGFVHRDLKPDNVMLGAFGEVMVMDWGVAKTLGTGTEAEAGAPVVGRTAQTEVGTVVGTRGFMAPEQARGGFTAVDGRADIYSLGAILALLLTGETPPLDDAAGWGMRSGARIPRPLRAIFVRALAADPVDRYPSVKALADDVAKYRSGMAVDAHRETLADRARRYGRTYRMPILLVLAYLIMRAIVAVVGGR
jgi:serine/threonine protein kinase